jgi:hypothetical protein
MTPKDPSTKQTVVTLKTKANLIKTVMLEYGNNGFWPPARRVNDSERIIQCWINGPATDGIEDKIKMANIVLKTNIPSFHNSIIPIPGQIRKLPKKIYVLSRL